MAARKKKDKMYMNNPNLPAKGAEFEYTEEMLVEMTKCKEDILHFAENYFHILNIDEGRQKIKLYDAQKRILKGINDNRFFILCASRQIGKCFSKDTNIKIRNKITGEIEVISAESIFNNS